MFRGRGRGNNRRSGPYDPNRNQQSRERGGSNKDRKTEWNSYKRPDNNSIKTETKPAGSTNSPALQTAIAKNDPIIKDEQNSSEIEDPYRPKDLPATPSSVNEKIKNEPIIPVNPPADTVDFKSTTFEQRKDSYEQKSLEQPQAPGRYTGRQGEKKFSGRCRLFVANMSNGTTEDELRALFAEFGETGELYINKDKGFGFIRLDYRHNAELAKSALDKKMFKGRQIQVRFATHASAIELHGLDQFASNEFIENAMTQFGNVERSVVVCDDRGRTKGYAIVEFEWKKSAQKVLDRFKEEMFVLGRLPKPIFAKPRSQQDEEEGLHEAELERNPSTKVEREWTPRFISPSSFEYTWAKKWRDLYIEEEDKKAKLEQELQDARYGLELDMEAALREQETIKIRDELLQRQDELRRLEEDMKMQQEMNQRAREQLLNRHRNRNFEARRSEESQRHSRDVQSGGPQPHDGYGGGNDNSVHQNEMILHQQAELELRRGELFRLGINPDMIQAAGVPVAAGLAGLPPHAIVAGLQGVMQHTNPRGPPPGMQMHEMQMHMVHNGPPPHGRDFPPREDDRFDNKRSRRD